MRYLNKIVFINSANIPYSEIEIDGNVHLIGDQGSGKSTLLRAILFFYNANKTKLGIPREKKSFDDYYFTYQNSYIIYEVIKDEVPYCVLAYKVNGKVAFRFIDSGYKRELFIDDDNRAFESWDHIRSALGRNIHYSSLVTGYDEFRRIIYGDNKALNPNFRKYALIESRQFQNIPRTIQNVFLNSNLEAKFIKDTIINSLDEDEFTIDIENYANNHLREFETQINDIKIWFKENNKGQIPIRIQANRVIDKYRVFNFLNREKEELVGQLSIRMSFIERESPRFLSEYSIEKNLFDSLLKQKENLSNLHKKREQDLISDLKYILRELKKAKDKQSEYELLGINEIIKKVYKKENLSNKEKTLNEEKNLLTSQFSEIKQKYEALIAQAQIQQLEFKNKQEGEINQLNADFTNEKEKIATAFQKLIQQILEDNEAENEKAENELDRIKEKEDDVKRKKAELKYQTFFKEEIEVCKAKETDLNTAISQAKSNLTNSKNSILALRREWELETKEVERNFHSIIKKEKEKQQDFQTKIQQIETKIKQSQSSFYGWLNNNYPNWENTIGKVIDEENALFNSELHPKLADKDSNQFFGIELNLNSLKSRVKTIKEYHQEIEDYRKRIDDVQNKIIELNDNKDNDLQKLKNKFNKQIKQLKDEIAGNEYIILQNEERLKKNKIDWGEWTAKSKNEKKRISEGLENELNQLTTEKQKAKNNLEQIRNGIKRKITLKENERNTEIASAEESKNEKIKTLKTAVEDNEKSAEKRIAELKAKQTGELDTKGADTKRLAEIDSMLNEIDEKLNYIKDKEQLVIEYYKDKREIFDQVPQWRADKTSLEKKQAAMADEHKAELAKINSKCVNQENKVKSIQSKLNEFENDSAGFENFQKSEIFSTIQNYFSNANVETEIKQTAISLISEISNKYYEGIKTFKELQQSVNNFNGNFNEQNLFSFKVKLNEDEEYLNFAAELKEFVEEDKINEFEKRVNERFANIIHLIGRETTELNSKEAEIEKIITKINDDFVSKNFVQAIKEMEMRTQKSSNPIVKLLVKIKEFNDENGLLLGESNLFTSDDSQSKNQKAVELLRQLVKELEKTKSTVLTLSESFDLQFRIVENDNDSGWVEKLSNVGSEGTDVLVKAMINILLLNVFKETASRKFKDFKLHCMMDEIGRLHPNNVRGILRFANERNILLINGSPTSQNAIDYKYTFKLAKEQSATNPKKYVTKINRLVKVNQRVLKQ